MPQIKVSHEDHRTLGAIAALFGTDRSGAVRELLEWADSASDGPLAWKAEAGDGATVAVYAKYKGQRVEGLLDPLSGKLTITSPPWNGRVFTKPSSAAGAVISHLSPERGRNGGDRETVPSRNGWDFWYVTETGKTIQSVRPGGSRKRRE
ncbi:hypothetical protein [Nocardiopsis halotolerans]|uniref:hypothetical protein n=1 Tax=Nocardiopsis halotolerans TaxID=124252 RepID=UPI00038211B8|nr:hypothetical protein [Nocardiopsis halotolerans]